MSDEEYPEEDYEYEYSEEDDDGDDGDVSMDGSTDAGASGASARRNSNPNKKRPFGSMDGKRRSGDNPNAPPLSGGEFEFHQLICLCVSDSCHPCTASFGI